MSRTQIGTCHLCGNWGELSFEHVPPRGAFNDRMVMHHTIYDYKRGPGQPSSQRGVGACTLCHPCNNNTGSWYGPAFVEWCRQGLEILEKAGWRPTLYYRYHIYPLRVIKQIVTMVFSVNGDDFQQAQTELVRFVLNKRASGLPPDIHVYLYFNRPGMHRMGGVSAVLKDGTRPCILLGEIGWVPFGYVMTHGSPTLNRELLEITYFANYGYDDIETIELRPPVLETNTPFPLDYRSEAEIQADYLKNLQYETASGQN